MTDSVLDPRVFTDLRELMGDDLGEFIITYLGNSPQLIHKMEQALNNKDTEALFHAAHQLKGGSGSIGALKLADLALQIEKIGKSGSIDGISSLLQQLQAEYAQLERELAAYK